MNQLEKVFNYQDQQVRTIVMEGQPWFAAKDVCDVLEIKNTTDSIKRLDEDEVTRFNLGGLSGETNFVSEPGLFSLILGSRKPEAKTFKRWITHEVIPSIRKHGGYLTPEKVEEALLNPDTLIQLATQLKQEREEKAKLLEQSLKDRPKVIFAEALEVSENTILIGELAKLLKQNGLDIGEKRLFEKLRSEGYLMKTKGERWNDPTQRSLDLRLFEIKKRSINNPDGSVRTTKTTKVTGKGQIYFINKFKNELLPV
jgi:anti-repressor protein